MDYLLGALTIIAAFVIFSIFSRKINDTKPIKLKISQSKYFELVRPISSINRDFEDPYLNNFSQSFRHKASKEIMVIFMENQAYWIKDNTFYVADVLDGNQINKDSIKVVDTMSMDKVQLDKMIFIVDQLSKGMNNDSGNPRDKGL